MEFAAGGSLNFATDFLFIWSRMGKVKEELLSLVDCADWNPW
jgi:hypothetical protein